MRLMVLLYRLLKHSDFVEFARRPFECQPKSIEILPHATFGCALYRSPFNHFDGAIDSYGTYDPKIGDAAFLQHDGWPTCVSSLHRDVSQVRALLIPLFCPIPHL